MIKNRLSVEAYELQSEEISFLRNCKWYCAEKIDGFRCGVVYNDGKIYFQGRRSNHMPTIKMLEALKTAFTEQNVKRLCLGKKWVLYVEFYGNRIATCRKYDNKLDFVVIDCYSFDKGRYLNYWELNQNLGRAGLKIVPLIFYGNLEEIETFVASEPKSQFGDVTIEGVIARPFGDFLDKNGKRIIFKHEVKIKKEKKKYYYSKRVVNKAWSPKLGGFESDIKN